MSATFPAVGSPPVMPVESPTVPNAEADSKMLCETLASLTETSTSVQVATATSAIRAHRKRLPLRGGADPAAEDVDLRVSPDLGPDHEHEQGERRHLDPAARRGAPGTDEHEHVLEQQGRFVHLRVVDGVEARRAWLHPLEEGRQQLSRRVERPERAGVSPLEAEHGEEADREQQARHEERQLRVERPARRAAQLAAQLEPDGEADAAEDDRERDRDRHPAVRHELHQVVAPEREAGVVERRDRVEDAAVDRRRGRVVVREREAQREHDRGDRLEQQAEGDDPEQDAPHLAEVERTRLGLRDQARPKPEPPGDDQRQHRGERHDPEAADLDEQHDHDLAEGRPVDGRVDDDQPGDADRRRRRERRGQEAAPRPAPAVATGSARSPVPSRMAIAKASETS